MRRIKRTGAHLFVQAALIAVPLMAAGPALAAEPTNGSDSAPSSARHAYLEAGDALGLEIYGRELSERAASEKAASTLPREADLLVAAEPAPKSQGKPAR